MVRALATASIHLPAACKPHSHNIRLTSHSSWQSTIAWSLFLCMPLCMLTCQLEL